MIASTTSSTAALCTVGIESTVLSLAGELPVLLRPGGVSRAADRRGDWAASPQRAKLPREAHPSPGMHPRHYSPRTQAAPGALRARCRTKVAEPTCNCSIRPQEKCRRSSDARRRRRIRGATLRRAARSRLAQTMTGSQSRCPRTHRVGSGTRSAEARGRSRNHLRCHERARA